MAWGWRGRGRGGGWAGQWPGRGPFSYLPPWQRPGWLFRGFNRGTGFGRRGYPYNPWVCRRFPWLPRWWWAGPEYSYRLPYMAYGPYDYPPTSPAPPASRGQELEGLEAYKADLEADRADLEQELNEIEARIKERKAAIGQETGQGP